MKSRAELHIFFDYKVTKLFNELEKCMKNPAADEIHDLRVAARRLFTYLSSFYSLLCSEQLKGYLRYLKKTLSLLGRIRELDICSSITNKYISTYKLNQNAISELSLQILTERNNKYRNLIRNNSFRKVISGQDTLSELISINLKNPALKGKTDNNKFILGFLKNKINDHYKDLINPSRGNKTMSEIEVIHSKRIKAKGIRYLTELINELFNGVLAKYTDKIKNFTDTSGDLHDYDVLKALSDEYFKMLTELKGGNSFYNDENTIKFSQFLNSKIEILISRTLKITRQIESKRFLSSINSIIDNQISIQ